MKALLMDRYGGPDAVRIDDVAPPVPAAGEVLVRERTAGLNPLDHKIREGKLRVVTRLALPCVMGNELAGEVADFAVGDRVFARIDKTALGVLAEFTCVPETLVAPMPHTLDFEHAAAVPLTALTALQALRDELRVRPGMRLLITGGAGGVGSFAIPLARHYGARVTTEASRASRGWCAGSAPNRSSTPPGSGRAHGLNRPRAMAARPTKGAPRVRGNDRRPAPAAGARQRPSPRAAAAMSAAALRRRSPHWRRAHSSGPSGR